MPLICQTSTLTARPQRIPNLSQITFLIFKILTYEISKTTEPIELKFSGIREGVNKLAVLKFQSNPISLRKILEMTK